MERCGNNKGRGVRSGEGQAPAAGSFTNASFHNALRAGATPLTDRDGTHCAMQCTATEHNVWQCRAPPRIPRSCPQVPGQETLAFGRSQYIFGKWRIHRQARQHDTPSRAHAPI